MATISLASAYRISVAKTPKLSGSWTLRRFGRKILPAMQESLDSLAVDPNQ